MKKTWRQGSDWVSGAPRHVEERPGMPGIKCWLVSGKRRLKKHNRPPTQAHTHKKMSRLSDGLDLVSKIERERENEDTIFSLRDGRTMKFNGGGEIQKG